MHYLFMDEKGPQNSFKIAEPFDKTNKLSYANDNMHSYVANVIQIGEEDYEDIKLRYNEIVETYLSTKSQLPKNKELKGSYLLKKNFNFGIASMKDREVQFYTSLFRLLNHHKVDNLLFMISKMSIITSSRLTNFFYFLDEETEFSPFLAKYVLTKYAEIEASQEVVEALLDKKMPTQQLLNLIKEDLKRIIKNNQGNLRMAQQLAVYQQLIMAIDKVVTNHKIKLAEPEIPLSFDWNKVKWAFDLWLSEQKISDNHIERTLFLDEGIPSDIFNDLAFAKIEDNCKSKNHVGLQITDMIVVLIGKLVSQMNDNVKYDFNKSNQRKLLNQNYFNLNEQQYELILEINSLIFEQDGMYHFVNDAFFDESVLVICYFGYISSFNSFKQYNSVSLDQHVEWHFSCFVKYSQQKYNEGMINETETKYLFGSLKEAIHEGMLRPL